MKPWMKWFPTDWRGDPCLRMCPLNARGLWIEMLGYMHESDPTGYFLVNGVEPSTQQLAMLVGAKPTEVATALSALEANGVFSRDERGRIYSRRIIRDVEKAERDRTNGKGGGNPQLLTQDKGWVNPPHKAHGKALPEARSQKPENQRDASHPVGLVPDDATQTDLAGPKINGHDKGAETQRLRGEAVRIIEFLNDRSGKNFYTTPTNVNFIVGRFREGFTPLQVRQVVAMKVREWKNDAEWAKYLRPETLFNATKFSSYVGEIVEVPEDDHAP